MAKRFDRRVFEDFIADRLGGDGHHVLAGRVAGGELEVEIDMVALDRAAEVHQPAVRGGGGRDALEFTRNAPPPRR